MNNNYKDKIHMTPEEIQSSNSDASLQTLSQVRDLLKGVTKMEIKGDKGNKGDIGPQGPAGEGIEGPRGQKGIKGDKGESIVGLSGKDGKDGTEILPDEVVDKVNSANKKIKSKQVEGLSDALNAIDKYGENLSPQGHGMGAGGSQPIVWLASGVRINDFVTEINLSTNITAVYAGNGRVTLTATGGGGTTYSETPSGLINGANTTYTTAHSITTVINMAINGEFIHPAEYVVSGAGFTMGTAPSADLSGKGFTIIYQ